MCMCVSPANVYARCLVHSEDESLVSSGPKSVPTASGQVEVMSAEGKSFTVHRTLRAEERALPQFFLYIFSE